MPTEAGAFTEQRAGWRGGGGTKVREPGRGKGYCCYLASSRNEEFLKALRGRRRCCGEGEARSGRLDVKRDRKGSETEYKNDRKGLV